jgi:ribonucleoside-diphosphate reductase alpha chain
MGVFSGDGSIHTETGKRSIWLYGKKKALLDHINKRTSAECDRDRICATLDNKTWSKTFVPNATYDTITKLNWLSGLLDTDGSYNGTGSVSINSSDKDFLYEIKLMLMCLGTPSTLAMYKDKEDKMMPDGKGGKKLYTCQPSYRLSIAGYYVTQLIGLGLSPKLLDIKHLVKRSQAKNITIVNIENGLKADTVYCFTDPKRSMGLFNCVSTLNCGEQPLENGGNCTLASINLAKYYDPATNYIDTEALTNDVSLMQHALDNVVEINTFPVDIVTEQNKKTRRIGGGIMGWADLLFLMGIPYNSEAARDLAETIMEFISETSYQVSMVLAESRGTFLDWKQSDYKDKIRNAYRNTIAPTGTISIIADCSGGIEPIFSLAFTREVLQGANGRRVKMFEGNKIFETKLRAWLDSKCTGSAKNLIEDFVKEIIKHAATKGTLKDYIGVPALWDGWKEFIAPFVTTKDIDPKDHVLMQAAWQKHVDTAISKTINLNNNASVEDVIAAYKLAYETECKGITVYRDGSRDGVAGMAQPMKLDKPAEEPKKEDKPAFKDIKWEAPGTTVAPPANIDPEVSNALKVKQVTPMGNLHVTCVLGNDNLPIEIFAQISKAGEQPAADLEAICRLASMYLRESKNFDEVIKQLEHIGSSTLMPSKDGQIKSLPDGLSLALKKIKKVLSKPSTQKIDTNQPVSTEKIHIVSTKNDTLYAQVCPNCNKKLIRSEGCMKCEDSSCGFSKC